MSEKPRILSSRTLARTRVFHIEELELRFSNGAEVTYERLRGSAGGAVLIVPLLDDQTVLLVREYVAGLDRYELSFPKGLVEKDESTEQAANRELMEEAGYAAGKLTHLMSMSLAPAYLDHMTHVVMAEDLYERRLPGDEPETIEVVPWKISAMDELTSRDDFSEARSIAALYIVKQQLADRKAT
jgi:ADP-ribose diphosphatase